MLRRLLSYLRTRRELERLSDRALRDIGIEPSAVRPPRGPSILVPQPVLLARLRDPPAAPFPAPRSFGPGRPLPTIHLRAPATRPI
jgi:hypothetical protein